MAKVILYNQEGEKKGDVTVSDTIFAAKFNGDLIHQALIRQLSNARPGVFAHTKTKAEVKGGGRKPFRQKGTGNARQGSIRNPHYIGGGVAFGPRNERNFQKEMPKKQRRLALFSALSAKLSEDRVIALDEYKAPEIKTKNLMICLHKLPIEKDVLVVLSEKNEIIQKSVNNLPFAKAILVNYLNIADLQKFDHILFMEDALGKMEDIFLPKE
jgi:large subunit ribosomal protein L4